MWGNSTWTEFNEDWKAAFTSNDLDDAHDMVEQTTVCWVREVIRFVHVVCEIRVHGEIDYAVFQGCWKIQQPTASYDDGLCAIPPSFAAENGCQVSWSIANWFGTCICSEVAYGTGHALVG